MANQESEMEPLQNLFREYGRVARLWFCVVRVWRFLHFLHVVHTVGGRFGRSYSTFDPCTGGSNACRFPIGRDKILSHILDEETLALLEGK